MITEDVQRGLGRQVGQLRESLAGLLDAMAPESAGSPLHAAQQRAERTLAEFDRFVAGAAEGEPLSVKGR